MQKMEKGVNEVSKLNGREDMNMYVIDGVVDVTVTCACGVCVSIIDKYNRKRAEIIVRGGRRLYCVEI